MRRSTMLLAVLAVACAPAEDQPAEDQASQGMAEASEPRVALAPTSPDQMPPAIVGQGGPLQGMDLQYYAGHPETVGYLAVPDGEGPFPALIIIHEWNGLVDRVRQVADDFAAEGYVTLAADLYSSRTGTNPEENMVLVQEARGDMDQVIANLNAASAYLRGRPDVTGRVGAMGWCFGGGIALAYGLDGDDHEATAIFYGALSDDPEVLATLNHEVYGSFGVLDSGPSPEQVSAFEAALQQAGIEHDLHVYDGVGHAFWLQVEAEPEARTEPSLDAWQRLKAYLGRTLGG